jgi:stage II sporulation protein D
MLLKFLMALLVGLGVFFAQAQSMRIGLFPNQKFTKIKFANALDSYFILADTTFIGVMDHFSFCEISKGTNGTMDVVFQGTKTIGVKEVKIIASQREKSLEISGLSPGMKARAFEGDFLVRSVNGVLLMVNLVDLETYLEGVVESEAGTGQKLEYYKVQAIISRTFAMKSKQKHAKEGFDLCNQVHCQAYLHKRNGAPIIDSAIKATRGQIMIQQDSSFAPTFFSANCGGQTCEPSHVWNASISGLSSFCDTFCIYTKQATWTKQLPLSQWKSYLVEKYHYPIDDSISAAQMLNWTSNTRPAFLFHPGYGIPMRDIREHFNLKSAFFSVSSDGTMVTLSGKGYGHGVGLCQEGAMKMARLSYSYNQILGFYFPSYSLSLIASDFLLE